MMNRTPKIANKIAKKASSPTIQTKLTIGTPNDKYEREADSMANHIMRMPQSFSNQPLSNGAREIQRKCTNCEKEEHIQRKPLMMKSEGGTPVATQALGSQLNSTKGSGSPLPSGTNSFMSNAFGADFSNVRIHTGGRAIQMNQGLNARAFTHGSDIYFNRGQYSPGSSEGKRLLGHELTHVVQQGTMPSVIRRAVELRPPGAGEASAFDRAKELIDRLTNTSTAVTYTLGADGRTIEYQELEGATQDAFDVMMTGFIDETQVIPLRLITNAGLVRGPTGAFEPLTGDSFVNAYVDIDDLLGSSDIGFKLLLGHFITERLQVRDYARRIGTAGLIPLFNNAHARGREAEAVLLQGLLGDPSVRFHYDELKPNGTTFVRAFRSLDESYRVFWVIRGHRVRSTISISDIRVVDGVRRLSIEDFIAERVAVPAAAP